MALTITVPEPARFSKGYILIWGLAELGKSLVFGTFGALLPIFYQDYLLHGCTLQKMQADVLALHAAKHAMLKMTEAS